MTCRSEFLTASPAAVAIEVPAFTMDERGERIILTMSKKTVSDDENLAAHELSERIRGLALAIKATTGITEPCTSHQRPGNFDPYYLKFIDIVGQTAFEHLEPDAARLTSLFCFTLLNGILQWILAPIGACHQDGSFQRIQKRIFPPVQGLLY